MEATMSRGSPAKDNELPFSWCLSPPSEGAETGLILGFGVQGGFRV